jgi:undecaprenyl phosphate-alpha-L-ara4N flippase subunit ArnE
LENLNSSKKTQNHFIISAEAKMFQSIRKNKKGILLMAVSSLCVCFGQLLWKISAERGLIFAAAGFGFYGIGALSMITAYRFGKLSVLQPVLSLNYVLSIVLAAVILHERITILKCAGVATIVFGVLLIAGGDE